MRKERISSSITIRRPIEDVFDLVGTHHFDYLRAQSAQTGVKATIEVPDGPVAVGSRGYVSGIDGNGLLINSEVRVLEYQPPNLLSLDYISTYAAEQPNKPPPSRFADSSTRMRRTYRFASVSDGTMLSVDYDYDLGNLGAYGVILPYWTRKLKEQLDKGMISLRDKLETDAGLPKRKPPFVFKRVWVVWSIYVLVFLVLLWLHGMRESLGLGQSYVDGLRTVMSLMVVIAFVYILATRSFARR